MEANDVKTLIRQTLPDIVRTDPEFREFVLSLTRERFAGKEETESRFDRIMAELQRSREEQGRLWDENQKRWNEMWARWDENQAEDRRKWEEQKQLWAENQRRWDENRAEDRRKWDEQKRLWDENQAEDRRKWDENQKEIARRYDSGIGALGARWGMQTEASFRNALKAILEDSFGVEVLNYLDYDDEGKVFGRPDQIELDIIIKNGHLILCEIKSSMSRSDVYAFDRKTAFYEEKHGRQADRRLVISPMVEERAQKVAETLGIEVYSYADTVKVNGT